MNNYEPSLQKKKEDQGIEPVEVTFPVAPSEDESPEEVEEYIDENGMRVRRIVRRTITTTTIKRNQVSSGSKVPQRKLKNITSGSNISCSTIRRRVIQKKLKNILMKMA